jgi:hypothetical protein
VSEIVRLRPTLGHLLGAARARALEEGVLTVTIDRSNAFTEDQVQNQGNRQLLVETARRVHPGLREVVFVAEAGGSGPADTATAHPLVQAAVELFDGEVTGVRPASPRAPSGPAGRGTPSRERP